MKSMLESAPRTDSIWEVDLESLKTPKHLLLSTASPCGRREIERRLHQLDMRQQRRELTRGQAGMYHRKHLRESIEKLRDRRTVSKRLNDEILERSQQALQRIVDVSRRISVDKMQLNKARSIYIQNIKHLAPQWIEDVKRKKVAEIESYDREIHALNHCNASNDGDIFLREEPLNLIVQEKRLISLDLQSRMGESEHRVETLDKALKAQANVVRDDSQSDQSTQQFNRSIAKRDAQRIENQRKEDLRHDQLAQLSIAIQLKESKQDDESALSRFSKLKDRAEELAREDFKPIAPIRNEPSQVPLTNGHELHLNAPMTAASSIDVDSTANVNGIDIIAQELCKYVSEFNEQSDSSTKHDVVGQSAGKNDALSEATKPIVAAAGESHRKVPDAVALAKRSTGKSFLTSFIPGLWTANTTQKVESGTAMKNVSNIQPYLAPVFDARIETTSKSSAVNESTIMQESTAQSKSPLRSLGDALQVREAGVSREQPSTTESSINVRSRSGSSFAEIRDRGDSLSVLSYSKADDPAGRERRHAALAQFALPSASGSSTKAISPIRQISKLESRTSQPNNGSFDILRRRTWARSDSSKQEKSSMEEIAKDGCEAMTRTNSKTSRAQHRTIGDDFDSDDSHSNSPKRISTRAEPTAKTDMQKFSEHDDEFDF